MPYGLAPFPVTTEQPPGFLPGPVTHLGPASLMPSTQVPFILARLPPSPQALHHRVALQRLSFITLHGLNVYFRYCFIPLWVYLPILLLIIPKTQVLKIWSLVHKEGDVTES